MLPSSVSRSMHVLACAASFGLLPSQALSETTILKYGWFGPATEPTYVKSMAPFGEAITKDSNGSIKVEMYPGGTLGKSPRSQVKYLQDGVLDISFVIPSYTPGRFPDNGISELPIYRSATEATLVTWNLYKKGLLRGYEKLHVLQLAASHPNLIHAARPIKKIAALKGLKLRVSGPTAGATVRALGSVPVGIPVTQAAEGISRGLLDGTVQDWNTYAAFRLTDVAKNHLGVHMGQATMLVAMTKRRYESLPAAAKVALKKHAYEKLSLEVALLHDEITATWRKRVLKEPGHVLVEPDAAERARFKKLIAPVVDDWAKKHPRGAELLAAARKELAEIRKAK